MRVVAVGIIVSLAGCATATEQEDTAGVIPLAELVDVESADEAERTLVDISCGGSIRRGLDSDGDGWGELEDRTEAEWCASLTHRQDMPGPDCDDSDPERFRFGFSDRDGDGVGGADDVACFGDELPEGYAATRGDCDDDDPEAFRSYWLDEDGDGQASDFEICAGETAPPNAVGFSRERDCDDADPEAFSGAVDFVGDGVDQDCDGSDGVSPDSLPETWSDSLPMSANPDCADDTDLFIHQVEVRGCTLEPIWYVEIGNRGSEASSGDVLVVLSSAEKREIPLPDIPPGGATGPAALGALYEITKFRFDVAPDAVCNADAVVKSVSGEGCPDIIVK